jgi:hypothetical protein
MKIALCILLCFLPVFVSAQTNNIKIETSYDSTAFLDFARKIEKEYAVKFYFKKAWLDSVKVKQNHVPTYLGPLLDESFKGLNLNYLIDGKNIIITKNYKIINKLSESFFKREDYNGNNPSDTIDLKAAFIVQSKKTTPDLSSGPINIGGPVAVSKGDAGIVSGNVLNEENGEPIIGAQVYVKNLGKGTITDVYGNYSIALPKGRNEILFRSFGSKELVIPVMVNKDVTLNVSMKENLVQLNEVVVTADKENLVKNLKIGVQSLNMKEIKQLPLFMGEADIIKSAILLPGVQTVGEGASGFNVRGGSADQNLMLFDDAPIFNSSHLFGFFSVFNPEVIKDFTLYKSGIPARYGGRVSSIFDVTAKQGNLKKYVVSGGISPITGKLTVEGPIIKDKLSFIIGGRSTYSNWILREMDRAEFKNSKTEFYDISGKISYDINKNNLLTITGYKSKDYFKLNSDTAYHYENTIARLFFKHTFSSELYGTLSAIYSNYQYNIASDKVPVTSFNLKYNLEYKSIKTEFFYSSNPKHVVKFGSEVIKYNMTPGDFTPLSSSSDISVLKLPKEQGVEAGLFINDDFNINSRLTISGGLRYAAFFVLGPYKVYDYRSDVSRSVNSRIDSTVYPSNRIVKTYGGPEIRLSARYNIGLNNSVKLSYSRIHQFLHMVTNSSAISPTDVWKISDAHIKPLIGDQIAIGYYHNFFSNTLEASAEIYYKKSKDNLDYKSGAELLLNPNLELDLLSGTGRAYGIEIFLKKKSGRLNGWISYTYSRTELKVDGKFLDEKINNGEFYPADYDKPHDFNLVTNYIYSRRISLSSTFMYSTGRPISYPVAKYSFRGRQLIHYSNRNEYRVSDYMRWDLALNLEGNLKQRKLAHSSWSFGVLNALGRKNVYSVFFKTTLKGVKGYQLSIFARPIVNVTYNFKF